MSRIKAFIIHLERAQERLSHVEVLQKTLPFETEVISAVDGRLLDEKTLSHVYQRQKYAPKYPFELSLTEIACFLSHRKAWAAIIEQKLDGGFIIEDDVALTEDFPDALALAKQHFQQADFIRFPFRIKEEGEEIAKTQKCRLIRPVPVGLGQVAQLVGAGAAQKLLQATQIFDRPVDTNMQLFWQTGVHPLSILPGGVTEISASLGGSTVQRKRQAGDKLKREILRPLYRYRLKRLSQKMS